MKKITSILTLLCASLLTGCGGGGDTPESISNEMISHMKQMGQILNTITDVDTAKAAVPKIEALRKSMRDTTTRAKALPKMDTATMQAFDKKMATDLAEVMKEVGPARMKLQEVMEKNPEVEKILEPALTGMEDDM